MHEIGSRRLMFKEVVDVRSNYKKSEGRGEKGQCELVCVERLWMIGLMLVYVFVHVWRGFNSLESWSYSKD